MPKVNADKEDMLMMRKRYLRREQPIISRKWKHVTARLRTSLQNGKFFAVQTEPMSPQTRARCLFSPRLATVAAIFVSFSTFLAEERVGI
jgi:hypothetical protein